MRSECARLRQAPEGGRDCPRWLWDEQSKAPCFPRLPKYGRSDFRGRDWASPQDLNLSDKTLVFRKKKKATQKAQAVGVSEEGVGRSEPVGSWLIRGCTSPRDAEKPESHSGAESRALAAVLPDHWGTLWSARAFLAPVPRCFLRRFAARLAYLPDSGNDIGTWANDSSEAN